MAIKAVVKLVTLLTIVSYVTAQAGVQQVIVFDDKDFSGGSQDFPTTLPATGCAPCTEFNRIRTNSWESYVTSGRGTIEFFDAHGCGGKTSGKIQASQGLIPGTLADSADSFILCN